MAEPATPARRARTRLGEHLPLALLLAGAAALRFYGLDWDGGHWLHPDERQIYFVANRLAWPDSFAQALAPDSPLNPGFFAYGSFPIYLVRLVAVLLAPVWPGLRDPGNLHLVGRPLAALFDLGTVGLTYRLAQRLPALAGTAAGGQLHPSPRRMPVLAAALYAGAVLAIQAAHYYTADVLLAFSAVLTLKLAVDVAGGASVRRQVALGAALGLALATKATAAPLVLVVAAALSLRRSPHRPKGLLASLALAAVTCFLLQPYAFLDWQTFRADTLRESAIAWGRLDVPYTLQYAGTLPFLYSVWQVALWGLGLPLGMLGWAGLAASLVRWLRRAAPADTLLLAWAGPTFVLAGVLYARPPRYLLPLVPVLCILAARLLSPPRSTAGHRAPAKRLVRALAPGLTFAYGLAFVCLYAAPHPWVQASEWIYRNVPAGSALALEEWDSPLPLPLEPDGRPRRIEEYGLHTLPLYDKPDDRAKWAAIAESLAGSDYVVVASRRSYGSLPRRAERYPVAGRYHERLFAGDLGFELVAEFTRPPAWLNPPIGPLPGAVPGLLRPDESLVVYDRPRVLVWRNCEYLTAKELLGRLGVR